MATCWERVADLHLAQDLRLFLMTLSGGIVMAVGLPEGNLLSAAWWMECILLVVVAKNFFDVVAGARLVSNFSLTLILCLVLMAYSSSSVFACEKREIYFVFALLSFLNQCLN